MCCVVSIKRCCKDVAAGTCRGHISVSSTIPAGCDQVLLHEFFRDSTSKQRFYIATHSKLHLSSEPSYDVSSTLEPKAIQAVASKEQSRIVIAGSAIGCTASADYTC